MRRLTALGAVWLVVAGLGGAALAQGLPDVRLGNEAFREGDYAAAIGHYTDAIRSGQLVGEALAITYNNRGVAHGEAGDFDPAIADYSQALALRPGDATTIRNLRVAHVRRGEVDFASGAYDAAVADFTAAVELEPDHHLAYLRRGELYAELGLLDLAVEDLERAAVLSPGDPEIVAALERATQQRAAIVAGRDPDGSSAAAATDEPLPIEGGVLPPTAEMAGAGPAAAPAAGPAAAPVAELPASAPAGEPTPPAAAAEPAPTPQAPELATSEAAPSQTDSGEAAPSEADPGAPVAAEAPSEDPTIALRPEPAPRVAAVAPPAAASAPAPEATPEPAAEATAATTASPPVDAAPPADTAPAVVDAAPGEPYRVVSAVNYRAGPDNSADRLGTIDAGRIVQVTGDTLGWKHVIVPNGDRGFIYRTWLEPVSESQ